MTRSGACWGWHVDRRQPTSVRCVAEAGCERHDQTTGITRRNRRHSQPWSSVSFNPEAIYLFGSRARGDATPLSDFDLMMITPSDEDVDGIDLARAYEPLQGLGIACEIIPCSRPTFERERRARTGICRSVAREGRLLYERH